jgi:hypothetical protein
MRLKKPRVPREFTFCHSERSEESRIHCRHGGKNQGCFAKPLLSEIEGLNMTNSDYRTKRISIKTISYGPVSWHLILNSNVFC